MSPTTEGLLTLTATWVVLLAAFGGLVSCSKKAEKPPEQSEPAAVVVGPTNDEQLSAMLRGHPNSRQICIEGSRKYAYFLDYGPLQKPGEEPDGRWHGWLFIENVEFYGASNKAWWIINQGDNRYVQSYPDTSGLICRPQQ